MTHSSDQTADSRRLPPRAVAAGRALITVHDDLRAALDTLRDAIADGAAATVPRTRLEHCTAFCTAVTRHHTAEDAGAFPALAIAFPELAR